MESFMGYVAAAAVTVVVMEMALSIMPEGSMKSMGKMAAGICILLMLITPVKSCSLETGDFHLEQSASQEAEQKKSYDDIIMDVYNRKIQNMD